MVSHMKWVKLHFLMVSAAKEYCHILQGVKLTDGVNKGLQVNALHHSTSPVS